MYVSDQKTSSLLAIAALVIGPWVGVSREAWGWMLDILLLLSVLWIGRNAGEKGFRTALSFLLLGYGIALALNGFSSVGKFSLVPWAALVTLWAVKENFPQRATVFWSLIAAGFAGSIPALAMLHQGISQQSIQQFTQLTLDQYRQAGMLESFQQQGLSEVQIKSLLEQVINYVILLTPGLATITGFLKWGAVYYFFARWFPQPGQEYHPFSEWRIPWYAVWGMNLAVASYLIGDQFHGLTLRSFGINLMLIYGVVALVLGSSIAAFYLRSPFMSGIIKIALVITSFIYIQVTVIGLTLLGLFDLVLNFRRLPVLKKDDN
jgi:hypothetical protein